MRGLGLGLLAPLDRPENLLPGLESLLSKGGVCDDVVVSIRASLPAAHPECILQHSLAGRRLFFLSGLFGAESWESIEEV